MVKKILDGIEYLTPPYTALERLKIYKTWDTGNDPMTICSSKYDGKKPLNVALYKKEKEKRDE